MITVLRLTYQGVTVDFAIHEVVEIAKQLLSVATDEEMPIPNLAEYFDKLKKSLVQLREEDKTPIDLLPIAAEFPMIPPIIRPAQMRFVAKYIASGDPRDAYWLNVGGRMIRVDKKNNYVSDYGKGFSGINAASSLLSSVPLVPPAVFSKVEEKYHELSELTKSEPSTDPDLFLKDFSETENGLFYLHLMGQFSDVIDQLEGNYDTKKKLQTMSPKYAECIRIVKLLSEQYRLHKQKSEVFDNLGEHLHEATPDKNLPSLSAFLKALSQKSEGHKKFTEILGYVMVDMHNLMAIARGDAEPIFRMGAFSHTAGATYQEFEDAMEPVLKQRSSPQIASLMRGLLSGDRVEDLPDCLPSLTTAWFVAEASRDELAHITNLMVLDFVEGDIPYFDGGENQYAWRSLLINSSTGQRGVKLMDLYGHNLKPHEKGGMYPAAHDKSYHHSSKEKRDEDNHPLPYIPLNWLRQKQGHLILHWLHLMIGHYCPMVKAEIVEIDTVKGEKLPKNQHHYKDVVKPKDNRNSSLTVEKNQKDVNRSKTTLRIKEKSQSCKLSDYRRFWNKDLMPLRSSQTKLTLQLCLLEPLLALRMNSFDFCFSPTFNVESVVTLPMNFNSRRLKKFSTEWYTEDKIIKIHQGELGDTVTHIPQTPLEHHGLLKDNLTHALGEVIVQNKPAVIPLHVHGNHWTAMVIKKFGENSVQVIYNDSTGAALESEENVFSIVQIITEICPDASIVDLQLRQQLNDYDCGPFATDNMARLAHADTSKLNKNEIAQLLDKPANGSAIHLRQSQAQILAEALQLLNAEDIQFDSDDLRPT